MSDKVSNGSGQTVRIDGAEPVGCILTIEREIIPISSGLPRRDPSWEFVDGQGHYHAYASDGELPTLTEHVEDKPCDGSCGTTCGGEGYTETTYTCWGCDEVIQPGLIHGEHIEDRPGRYSWSLLIDGEAPQGKKLSVVIDTQIGRYFGFAIWRHVERINDAHPQLVRTTLGEASPLGRRNGTH